MYVGEARESLAAGEDPELTQSLLTSAHDISKDTMVGLRKIVQGMRPPVLDSGLADALRSLAGHSAIPVTLEMDDDVDDGVDAAVRPIAYFTAAELLTNAAKHSGATRVWLELERPAPGILALRVTDDGNGGAGIVPAAERTAPGHQTGLQGVADRLATVDGTMSIISPPGGPTQIDVTMPATVG